MYRLLTVQLVSKIIPEECGGVLIAIPKGNLELARALPAHKSLDEDELFKSLLTRADYRTVHELLDAPEDIVQYQFNFFRETKNLPAPHRISADGKKFWRIEAERSSNARDDFLEDLETQPLPPLAPA